MRVLHQNREYGGPLSTKSNTLLRRGLEIFHAIKPNSGRVTREQINTLDIPSNYKHNTHIVVKERRLNLRPARGGILI